METLRKDVRFAAKLLLKERGFTAAALLTLALCIGANTAMFSVIDSILLKPLPFRDPGQIVTVFNSYPKAGVERGSNGVPDFYDRLELQAFESLAMYQTQGMTIGEPGRPERVLGLAVTPSFFPLLGVPAQLGRAFTPEEGEPGNERQAVLSWGLWQEQYAGAPDVLGRTIRVNDVAHTIVGVMPRNFSFDDPDVRMWVPLAFTAEQRSDDSRHNNSWEMIGRLSSRTSVAAAQAQVDALNGRLDERFPQFAPLLKDVGYRTWVHGYQADLTREVRGTLWLLQAGVLFVLLIGCVNIANLMLVRSTSRHRELATRSALGAGHGRLVRQLLTESILLAGIGGAFGLLLGYAGVRAFAAFAVEHLPRGGELALDVRTLLVAALTSLAAGLVFGAIPVLRLRRADLSSVFRDEGRTGTAGRRTQALRGGLVVAQVSLAFALLVGAGLMIASFGRMLRVDPGFTPTHVLTASVSLPVTRYEEDADRARFTALLLEQVRALPGVTRAAVTNVLPFGDDFNSSVVTPEGYVLTPGEALISPINSRVSDDYFTALDIELIAGRGFDAGDVAAATPVAIIDRKLAEHFFPGQDPLGRGITQGAPGLGDDDELVYRTIVGVVDEVRVASVTDAPPSGHFYTPTAQQPSGRLFIVVRAAGEPTAITGALRGVLSGLDPDLPLYQVRTMEERMAASLSTERARMVLLAGFAGLALFLAAIGLYGVLAYSVAQRSAEIGIRMALGSTTRGVFTMVLRQGAALTALGLALGLGGSLVLARVVRSMLYDVAPTDPVVYAGVLTLLALTALTACAVPARRAARVDPLAAIRAES